VNGSITLLKRLIAAGYPVMIEKGFDPEPERLGWMGHYLLLSGYSDETQEFSTMDSYLGANLTESYVHIDYYWRHFNRVYLVAFPEEKRAEVEGIIGADMDDYTMYSRALQQAQAETQENPGDPFGWFNVGSNLVALGDFESAATAFDIAREKGTPWRMLWYQFGPYQAYLEVGGNRLYDVITLANAVLEDNIYSEEAYYYKGLAYSAQGEATAARSQLNKALNYNSNYHAARQALFDLSES
jgi:tetratricopeptide (TPR) repeat protein